MQNRSMFTSGLYIYIYVEAKGHNHVMCQLPGYLYSVLLPGYTGECIKQMPNTSHSTLQHT